MDIGFPGLMIATVAHPPVFGAKVQSFNAVKAKAMEGVIDVVQIPTGLAVIAKDFWTAKTARELLEIEWDFGDNKTPDSERLFHDYRNLSQTKGISFETSGDIESAMRCCHKTFEAEYVFPYLAHAPMEPLNCTVKLNDDAGCEIWAGTQWPLLNQTKVAGLLNCEPGKFISPTARKKWVELVNLGFLL